MVAPSVVVTPLPGGNVIPLPELSGIGDVGGVAIFPELSGVGDVGGVAVVPELSGVGDVGGVAIVPELSGVGNSKLRLSLCWSRCTLSTSAPTQKLSGVGGVGTPSGGNPFLTADHNCS